MIHDKRRDAADVLRRLIVHGNFMAYELEDKFPVLVESWNSLINELRAHELVISRRKEKVA